MDFKSNWILVADDLERASLRGRKRSLNVQKYSKLLSSVLGWGRAVIHVVSGEGRPLSKMDGSHNIREIVYGSPVEQILKFSRKSRPPKILVMGTRSRGSVKRFLFGSVSEKIISKIRIPVLLVGPKVQACDMTVKRKWKNLKILVPVDFSSATSRQIRKAGEIGRKLKAKIILFHSLEKDFHPVVQGALSSKRGREQLKGYVREERKRAAQRLEKLSLKLKTPSAIWISDQLVDPYSAILRAQETNRAGLILIPIRSRSSTSHKIGSQFRSVVANSKVPVLSIP